MFYYICENLYLFQSVMILDIFNLQVIKKQIMIRFLNPTL